jgi:hypothetical protein
VDTGHNTVQATKTDPGQFVPDVVDIPMRPGIAGATTSPNAGSLVYVSFANGDRSKPVVIAYDSNAAQSLTMNVGTGTSEHLTTIEAVVNLINQITLAAGVWPPSAAQINMAIAACETSSISPFTTGIAAALALKQTAGGDVGGTQPNIGCPNLKGG